MESSTYGFAREWLQSEYEELLPSRRSVNGVGKRSSSSFVSCEQLYSGYRVSCRRFGFEPYIERDFFRNVRQVYPGCRRVDATGKRPKGYVGLRRRVVPFQLQKVNGIVICTDVPVQSANKYSGKKLTKDFVIEELMVLYGEYNNLLLTAGTSKERLEAATAKERIIDKCAKITGSYRDENSDFIPMNHISRLNEFEQGSLSAALRRVLSLMSGVQDDE